MVHLAKIPTDRDVSAPLVEGLKNVSFDSVEDDSIYSQTVYGSRFAAADLPRHEMPEGEMPKEVYVVERLFGNPAIPRADVVTGRIG